MTSWPDIETKKMLAPTESTGIRVENSQYWKSTIIAYGRQMDNTDGD